MKTTFKQKAFELAKRLGCDILLEGGRVYLISGDIKSEFMALDYENEETWWRVWHNLQRWGDGCNLIQPTCVSAPEIV